MEEKKKGNILKVPRKEGEETSAARPRKNYSRGGKNSLGKILPKGTIVVSKKSL